VGVLGSVDVDANATTHRCSAKYTPSIINPTGSNSERSVASSSANAVSVIATNLRDTADLLVDLDGLLDRLPDWLQADPVTAREQPAEHPLQRHLARHFGGVEQLVAGAGSSPVPSAARTCGRATEPAATTVDRG
jgi:hypothetical protein